jgi:hypothetical protein
VLVRSLRSLLVGGVARLFKEISVFFLDFGTFSIFSYFSDFGGFGK